jgi:hypothetical protein
VQTALSISPFAAELFDGPPRAGIGLGHGYVLFGDQVLALTRPGGLRMPNGVESALVVEGGERATVSDGALTTATGSVVADAHWDPQPRPRFSLAVRPRPQVRLDELAGNGPGLTPLGDDILVGYLAAAALAGGDRGELVARAEQAGRRTTALSRTLLRLAARAHLPEAAHRLLVDGDPQPLLGFGSSSGKGIAFGLALFSRTDANEAARAGVTFRLGESGFVLAIRDAAITTEQASTAVAFDRRDPRHVRALAAI